MFSHPRADAVAGLVVFLVAVPLCLGIAVAGGVPPVCGLVAGVVDGMVVPFLSRSPLSVSGPAAGLTAVVLAEVARLGGLERFLAAVMVAGAIQLALGLVRAGKYAEPVPSSVVKGMLAAIGITIVLTQAPVAVGAPGLRALAEGFAPGPALIAAASFVVLYGWRHTPLARAAFLPPALVAVVAGALLARAFAGVPALALGPAQFVALPEGGAASLVAGVPRPDLGSLGSPDVLLAGLTIALVASIETLLSLQAVDRLDPLGRHSPPDRELVAQGAANALSGFLGGLPVTAVIVRSGANVAAGGRERLAALVHGVLLLGAVLFAAPVLNAVPLALDLLRGVVVGIVVGVAFVLHQHAKAVVEAVRGPGASVTIRFRRDGTFLAKPRIIDALQAVRDGDRVVIDGTGEYLDQDVLELLADFAREAPSRDVAVELRGIALPAPRAH